MTRAVPFVVSVLALLTTLSFSASAASAHAFDDVKNSFATLLSMDAPSAGWILGVIFIIVLLVVAMWAMNDRTLGLVTAGISMAFVGIVGWWPLYSLIFVGIIIAFLVLRPFGGGGGGE